VSEDLMVEAKSLLREALDLLAEEHDAHHKKCCVSDDDLCHIGEVTQRAEAFL
jgi:hypothetical protein